MRKIICGLFYAGMFMLVFIMNMAGGFDGNSHTPPATLTLSIFTLIMGIFLFVGDVLSNKSRIHKVLPLHFAGLMFNGLMFAYMIISM